MGLLKNIARIATDIVDVEVQVLPAILSGLVTGGVGGAIFAGLSVGTRAILSKINAESFKGEGLTGVQLDAVNISRIVQGLTPIDPFGVPLRGFVESIVRGRLAREGGRGGQRFPRRPTPGFAARERFAARALPPAARSTGLRFEPSGASLADVPITPRQRSIALPVGAATGTAVPTLLVSRKEQQRGQLFRTTRSIVFRGPAGVRARRANGRPRGSRTVVC